MKKLLLLMLFPLNAIASDLPAFIDKDFVKNAEFKCLNPVQKFHDDEKVFVDKLWDETLIYLKGYATALSTSTNNICYHSDLAVTETYSFETEKERKQCIMDNIDMQKLVKHIYAITENPEKAYQCFLTIPHTRRRNRISMEEALEMARKVRKKTYSSDAEADI